jgi:predicted nucleic acid-binding Zn ribbon protein
MNRRRRRRDPAGLTPFGSAANRWVSRVGLGTALCLGVGDATRWRELVGDDIADVSAAVAFSDGVLDVRVGDELAATLLRYSEAAVVSVCNEHCGDRTVRRIRILHDGPDRSI